MLRLVPAQLMLPAELTRLARLAAVIVLTAGEPVTAAVKPATARINEISAWLAATPAPVGQPASDRAAWAAVAARVPLREILTEADRLVNVAPPAVTDALYLEYSRTGSRTGYEAVYNSRRDRLTTFAWAESLDGRGRYLAAVQREVDAILDEKAWTLPAHDASLNNFTGRVVEVDLGAAMRGWSMATAGGWLGEGLGAARLERLQSEIRRRITDPYLRAIRNGPVGGMWWVHTNSNWNAVCHAGVVGATLAAVGDRAEVILDGGVRRGTDVLKALALGAQAVLLGRPVLWGLAANGRHGAQQVLQLLKGLPGATVASDGEVLLLIEQEQLMGRGIGFVDAHLLASARLTCCWLWSCSILASKIWHFDRVTPPRKISGCQRLDRRLNCWLYYFRDSPGWGFN